MTVSTPSILCLFSVGVAALTSRKDQNLGDNRNSTINPLALGFFPTPEITQPISLEIVGKIPKWLTGSLYRGAQGAWDVHNYTAEHWFDGFSRNHRFEISNGQVEYRSRNASDEVYDFVMEHGLYPGGTFGEDPCKVIFSAFESTFRDGTNPVGDKSSDSITVSHIVDFPGLKINSSTVHGPFVTLVTTTDANALQQIDPVTLEPIELFTYEATNLSFTGRSAAHPSHGDDGSIYNYLFDPSTNTYKIVVIEKSGLGRILANITDAPAAYIHSTFGTTNYVILIVWQADLKSGRGTVMSLLKPWDPDRQTLIYVVDKRHGGVVAKYTADPFFAFHEINSYEEMGSIVIDLPVMRDYNFLNEAKILNLRNNIGQPNAPADMDLPTDFRRYRLPDINLASRDENGTLLARPAKLEIELDSKSSNIELPAINQDYRGKPYRYAYGIHVHKPGFFADSIIKIDTKTRMKKLWMPKVNHMPSEPIFVASPNAASEDDGVLLTVALNSERSLSSLIIINAKNMEEIARAQLPIVMGYGFHGVWGGRSNP